MRRKTFVGAIVVGLALTVPTVGSTAAQAGPVSGVRAGADGSSGQQQPKRSTERSLTAASPTCRTVAGKASAASQQSADLLVCNAFPMSASAAARSALSKVPVADTSPAAVLPLPQWCIDHAFTGWWFTRTQACKIAAGQLTVTNVNTGAVVGTMTYNLLDYTYTTTSNPTWARQIMMRPVTIVGQAVGSTVQGLFTCSGACVSEQTEFPPQLLVAGGQAEGEAFFDSTATTPGAVGRANTTFTFLFTNPSWTGPSTSGSTTPVLQVRCDNATPGASAGCVFPDYEPVFTASSAVNPNFARHLRDAQASGLPGAPGGVPLTRLTDTTLSNRNGDTACPSSYTRPAGYSCDEYPFRSTHQGAFTGGGSGRTFSWCQIPQLPTGVTGPTGYSSCMIPAGENSSGGGFLGSFYSSNRVIEADPFFVQVT